MRLGPREMGPSLKNWQKLGSANELLAHQIGLFAARNPAVLQVRLKLRQYYPPTESVCWNARPQ